MNGFENAKELVDKNRLLVAISIAWIILSNLLYFSQVDSTICFRTFSNGPSSVPYWIALWNTLTIDYVTLYEFAFEPSQSIKLACAKAGFSYIGYCSFVSLPIFTIILFVITFKWVRQG